MAMDIVKELRGGAEDPMWDAHCEMPKRIAKAAANRIEQLESALRKIRILTYDCAASDGNYVREAWQIAGAVLEE
jgi:hypothetical protein